MNVKEKRTFVLVHGAWHGAWVWHDVADALRAEGHRVATVTLTGLGDRVHNVTRETNLSTHITDVVSHIEMEDLRDITLVGWSYGGFVVAGVTSLVPERIRSLIYLDTILPEDGKSVVDFVSEASHSVYSGFMEQGIPIPPAPMEFFGVKDPRVIDFVMPRLKGQPPLTFFEPVSVKPFPTAMRVSFVYCSGYGTSFVTPSYEKVKLDARIETREIESDHLCMLSNPLETGQALLALA
jgi:pimeloyl-ACP methyl ester carboxylesterase